MSTQHYTLTFAYFSIRSICKITSTPEIFFYIFFPSPTLYRGISSLVTVSCIGREPNSG